MNNKAMDGEDGRDEDHEKIIQRGMPECLRGSIVMHAGSAAECCAGIPSKHEYGGLPDERYDGDRL